MSKVEKFHNKNISFSFSSLNKLQRKSESNIFLNSISKRRIIDSPFHNSQNSKLRINHSYKAKILSPSSSTSAESVFQGFQKKVVKKFKRKDLLQIRAEKDLKLRYLTKENIKSILNNDSYDLEIKPKEQSRDNPVKVRCKTSYKLEENKDYSNLNSNTMRRSSCFQNQKIQKDKVFKPIVKKVLSVNISNGLTIKDDKVTLKKHKRSSICERLFFKVSSPFDCVEEHLTTDFRAEDKYKRFRMLLKRQEKKNIDLINEAKKISVLNSNLLKFYVTKLITKRSKVVHWRANTEK